MKKELQIVCPYCGAKQEIDQDSTIFYGIVRKLTDCTAPACLRMFVYEIEMIIDVVSWKVQGQDWDPGKQVDPAALPIVKANQAALAKTVETFKEFPPAKELEPVKLKLKRYHDQPVDPMAVLDWLTTNNYRTNYARGFIESDIYRYCKFAKSAPRAKAALDELVKLEHLVKIPEKMESCRGKDKGRFGYRLSFTYARKAMAMNEDSKIPSHYDNSAKPGRLKSWPGSPNYVQSTPKE